MDLGRLKAEVEDKITEKPATKVIDLMFLAKKALLIEKKDCFDRYSFDYYLEAEGSDHRPSSLIKFIKV